MIPARAARILAHYDVSVADATKIDTLWNTMLRLRAADGRAYVLRLCNPLVTDPALVEQEIAFVRHVAARGRLRVPAPVPNRTGAHVTVASADDGMVIGCMFEWIDGEDLRGRVTPEHAWQIGPAGLI
jgi:hydroxylysine kinase